MEVRIIPSIDLSKVSGRSIFLSEEWLSLYHSNQLVPLGIFNDDQKLIGGLCLYKKKKAKVLTLLTKLPFAPNCGLFYTNPSENPSKIASFNKSVMQAIEKGLSKLKFDIISIPFPSNHVDFQHFLWNKYKVSPSYTYQLNLTKDTQSIYNSFDPKLRNQLKKGEKDGITLEFTNSYSVIETIFKSTSVRNSIQIDSSFVSNMLHKFGNASNSFSIIAKLNERPLAATFCVVDNQKCYYILGGYESENGNACAGPLAVAQSIIKAKEMGCEVFDFEGSMIPKIESYFRSFGGEITPIFNINKAKLPIEMLLKIKNRNQF